MELVVDSILLQDKDIQYLKKRIEIDERIIDTQAQSVVNISKIIAKNEGDDIIVLKNQNEALQRANNIKKDLNKISDRVAKYIAISKERSDN